MLFSENEVYIKLATDVIALIAIKHFRFEMRNTVFLLILYGISMRLFVVHGKYADSLYVKKTEKCGYKSCNPVKENMINIHIIPHTHDDVGWILTVDQYYYKEVQYILDSVILELQQDPTKRFIFVEIAFFSRWFEEQSDLTKHTVKSLVNEGRLEFILGGWSMNDEAATHYSAIIDQHTVGFEYLREHFGKCGKPRVAWQIDPFGHSREQAAIFAQFGFDSLFLGRIDYQDKSTRENMTTMEMIWEGSPKNLGSKADIFTVVLPNCYSPPVSFNFDIFSPDPEIVDDPNLHDVNVDDRVNVFLLLMKEQAQHYSTNHLIVTMGNDFTYQAAHNWYKNLDKLIKYVNGMQINGSKINLIYSTPSCYAYSVNRAGQSYTTKQDDFFPYAHRSHSFWSGYFTSRPALKGYIRRVNNFFQAVKQLGALSMLGNSNNSTLRIGIIARAFGVAQHHDAVSGTAKQVVTYDYEERLAHGAMEGQKVYNDALMKLQGRFGDTVKEQTFCNLLNISVCNMCEAGNFVATIYNPIGRTGLFYVRLPVSMTTNVGFSVVGPNGSVDFELLPITPDTYRIPERGNTSSKFELVFQANLVPLGYVLYDIRRGKGFTKQLVEVRTLLSGDTVTISNKHISLSFNSTTGLLSGMSNVEKKTSIKVNQSFLFYKAHSGNSLFTFSQASGAYVFRPNGSIVPVISHNAKLTQKSYIVQGKLVQEVYQEFSPWITQVVRLYRDQPFAEFQWTVGPIPVNDLQGKEIVSRFSTNLNSSDTFYTDANGRELLKRRLNHRDTWRFLNSESVAGNYYPVNSRILIKDEKRGLQFAVLTDRSQGGSSLHSGEIELMVHRRLLYDDRLGVGEPLNEVGSDGKGIVVRGSHYIVLELESSAAAVHRDLAERLFMAPVISFSRLPREGLGRLKLRVNYGIPDVYRVTAGVVKATWSGLRMSLPDNIHLLTLEQYPSSGPVADLGLSYLLRLEHFYEKEEDANLSKPSTLNLKTLFSPFEVLEAVELTLGGDMVLSDMKLLKWNYSHQDSRSRSTKHNGYTFKLHLEQKSTTADDLFVTLKPMEIRTFQISIKAI